MKVEQRINRIASERIRFSYNLAAVLVLIMHCSGNLPVRITGHILHVKSLQKRE